MRAGGVRDGGAEDRVDGAASTRPRGSRFPVVEVRLAQRAFFLVQLPELQGPAIRTATLLIK